MATARRPISLPPGNEAPHSPTYDDPDSPQARLLTTLTKDVDRTPAVFQDALRSRDMHQKALTDMLEETLRLIKKSRTHMRQRSQNVIDTTKAYNGKFGHELSCARDVLRQELTGVFDDLDRTVGALEVRMGELEVALKRQHDYRVAHIEATLGPIRDEAARLAAAFKAEQRGRYLQEEEREKLLADQVEAMTHLIDAEDFSREQQLMAFEKFCIAEQLRIARRQSQLDKDARRAIQATRADHESMVQERIATQHGIIGSISSFVNRYREHLAHDIDLQGFKEVIDSATLLPPAVEAAAQQ